MPNTVEICNLGLSRIIGANLISSLNDLTREAELCNLHYLPARNSMISEFDFGFARKQAVLSLLTETIPQYTYSYQMPSDCLVAREIYNATAYITNPSLNSNVMVTYPNGMKIPFAEGLGSTGSYRTINTNQEQAQLIYTADIQQDTLMPYLVADALSWRLASELAIPLRGDAGIQDAMLKKYLAAVGLAKSRSASGDYEPPQSDSNYSNARL